MQCSCWRAACNTSEPIVVPPGIHQSWAGRISEDGKLHIIETNKRHHTKILRRKENSLSQECPCVYPLPDVWHHHSHWTWWAAYALPPQYQALPLPAPPPVSVFFPSVPWYGAVGRVGLLVGAGWKSEGNKMSLIVRDLAKLLVVQLHVLWKQKSHQLVEITNIFTNLYMFHHLENRTISTPQENTYAALLLYLILLHWARYHVKHHLPWCSA